MAVQVFTNYQGRILGLSAKVGDDVKNDQTHFTIDSPDLLQAEPTLSRGGHPQGRLDAGCGEPDHRTCHGPQRGSRALRTAGPACKRS